MIKLKTKEDIKKLKVGGNRHAAILQLLAKEVKSGVTTDFLNDLAEKLVREGGDEASFLGYTPEGVERPYPAALCVSINDEIVHGIPNEEPKTLKEGDIVTLDLGLTHEGMITDAAITVPVGKVSGEAKKLIKVCRESLELGVKQAVAGNHIGDISTAIHHHVTKHGFQVVEQLAGHGVGYSVHEDPYVPNIGVAGEGELLKPGMVIAIEPMITAGNGQIKLAPDGYTYLTKDGTLAAHFEHTVAITDGKPLVLTT